MTPENECRHEKNGRLCDISGNRKQFQKKKQCVEFTVSVLLADLLR